MLGLSTDAILTALASACTLAAPLAAGLGPWTQSRACVPAGPDTWESIASTPAMQDNATTLGLSRPTVHVRENAHAHVQTKCNAHVTV